MKTDINTIRKILKKANVDYHEKGEPTLTDAEYDSLKEKLFKLNPKDSIFKEIGSPARKNKVQLSVHMASLDKVYVNEAKEYRKWIKDHPSSSYLITDKLDGISLLVGKVKSKMFAHTRGNGTVGEDISYMLPYIKGIPELNNGTTLRGELVMSKANFTKFKDEFKNTRNLVSGIKNSKGIHPATKKTQFIVHQVISPNIELNKAASQLKNAGAILVNYIKVKGAPSLSFLDTHLKERLNSSPFDLDGIVVDDGKGNKIAIKAVNEVATVEIGQIQWQVSRHGKLTPVIILKKPVTLAGALVSRVTAHNALTVKEKGLGPGAIIQISRSGEVIPFLLGVVKKAKPQLPEKGTYEWITENEIRTIQSHDQSEIDILKFTHFFTVLGIRDFKQNQITKLYDDGLNTLPIILKAKESRFSEAGLGKVQSKKIAEGIKQALEKATMPKMMVASGCFPSGFGLSAAKTIYSEIEDRAFTADDKTLRFALENLSGIGASTIKAFLQGRKAFIKFIKDIKWTAKAVSKKGSRLSNMTIVFSGVRDSKLQDYLENNGATITSSVSKNTTHLIVKDKNMKPTEKMKDAKTLGIKIMSIADARNL